MSKQITLRFDPARIRGRMPFRVMPWEPAGKKASVWDADRVWVMDLDAQTHEELVELGRLIEAVTWELSRAPRATSARPAPAARPAKDTSSGGESWWPKRRKETAAK